MKFSYIFALIALAATAGTTATAQAGDWGLHGGLPWFGYGYSGSLYGLNKIPVPPYFALHPPVYYSQPIPRPYGHSPFAWRSYESDLHATSQPRMTLNPYYKTKPAGDENVDGEQTAKIITNPFVTEQQLIAKKSGS